VTNLQIHQDIENEKIQNIGTTKKGIGPTYSAKINRFGLRLSDLADWTSFTEKYNKMAHFYNSKTISE